MHFLTLWRRSTSVSLQRSKQRREVAGVGAVTTIIEGSTFFALMLKEFHELSSKGNKVKGNKWILPEPILDLFHGMDTPNEIPWLNCNTIIAFYCLDEHWVTAKIKIDD